MAKKEKKEKKEKSGLERVPVAAWVALIAVFFFYKQGGFGGGGGSSVSSGGGGGNSDIVGSNSAQTSGQNPKETYQIPKMKGPSYKNKMKQKFQVTVRTNATASTGLLLHPNPPLPPPLPTRRSPTSWRRTPTSTSTTVKTARRFPRSPPARTSWWTPPRAPSSSS
jgi:hypothetical protein